MGVCGVCGRELRPRWVQYQWNAVADGVSMVVLQGDCFCDAQFTVSMRRAEFDVLCERWHEEFVEEQVMLFREQLNSVVDWNAVWGGR